MSKRAEILAEARTWLGTPKIHQHALKGFGVDCWGLVRATGEACQVLTVDPEAWEHFQGYGEVPSPRLVLGCANTFLVPIQEPGVGDIALLQWRDGLPMHFSLVGEFRGRRTLIHPIGNGRRASCVEHGFTAEWPGLLHSWWSFPGLVGVA